MSKFIYTLVILSLFITSAVILGKYLLNQKIVKPPLLFMKALPFSTSLKLNSKNADLQDVKLVSNSINTFSYSFLNTLIKNDPKYNQTENIFFSPYSISSAFYMLLEGANKNTADEIATAFAVKKEDLESIRNGYASIYNNTNASSVYTLKTANAFWPQKDYKFLDSYTSTLKNFYGGESFPLNFKTKSQEAITKINNWAALKTENKIKKILSDVDPETKLVLTNAVYFKGDWINAFDKDQTRDEPFVNADKTSSTVKMMRMKASPDLMYFENDTLKMLELPYKGNTVVMYILLPNENNILKADEYMDPSKFKGLISTMQKEEVIVKMPKVKLDKEYNLIETLKKMGIIDAFNMNADLSKMDGSQSLLISQAIHKSYVDIYEEGTEAAAVTAVVVATKSMPMEQTTFYVDHPFSFVIYDKTTETILFTGRVVKL